ncbi:hypothetical protein Mlaev_02584 [Microbacterium laevaniformans]|uniref:DUF4349 domain-containing protein n=1 Tax=Microbacterium laevaniformans TaxID=36807 RepID=A0A150H6Q4_9MICO|nr:DUF4349 domain-containing protein [Microbacterium laevaniformans]KXZ57799.1 hypothetical protein Mlaev_02584 [Microbacterium laevaniformans]
MTTKDNALPELADDRVEVIEQRLFAQIAEERSARWQKAERERARAVRRGRLWMGGAAAAALVAVSAIIAPSVLHGVSGSSGASSLTSVSLEAGSAIATAPDTRAEGMSGADSSGGGAASAGTAAVNTADRQIAVSASATVDVQNAASAAQAIATAAADAGGYVESQSTGTSPGQPAAPLPDMGKMMPAPASAWITVRVPADALSQVVKGLSTLGTVTASQTDRRDVTTETLDLRARVSALETSVARLTDLMKQSSSTADLIAAESALSERQSELDSLRQQLTWTESQVAMSTLTVSLVEPSPAVTADPAGFGDGVAAGWNGLIATLNALVVAVGFLLPWLGVGLVVTAVVVLIVRARRRRHSRRNASAER